MGGGRIEQVIPDYELLAKVGEGGYGEVFLARSVTGHYRAVKIVRRDRFGSGGGRCEAFDREFCGAESYEEISRKHDALIDILHVGRNDALGFFWYVMDAADDERTGRALNPATYRPRTLRSELGARKALPMDECLDIGIRLASALMCLQDNGLVHRDIKPSNVIFVEGKAQLADIGLVSDVREAKSRVGSDVYEPPEHHGRFTGDIYSLGMVLYEASAGRDGRNFGEAPGDEADTDDPRFAGFNEIVMKACSERPEDRFQTARAMLKALQELQGGAAGRPGVARKANMKRPAALAAVAGLVVIVTVAGVNSCRSHGGTGAKAPVGLDPSAIQKPSRLQVKLLLSSGEWLWCWDSDPVRKATVFFKFSYDGQFTAEFRESAGGKKPAGGGLSKAGCGEWFVSEDGVLTVLMTQEKTSWGFKRNRTLHLIDYRRVVSVSHNTVRLEGNRDCLLQLAP